MASNYLGSLWDIEVGDYQHLPPKIRTLLKQTVWIYNNQGDFEDVNTCCEELLEYVKSGFIDQPFLVIKIIFLISKCRLEMGEFIAAKYFLDKTYQLVLSICPEKIHELDPFLIEVEERQNNIVGAFVLSILFRELREEEKEDRSRLKNLKTKLVNNAIKIGQFITNVFNPLFETAEVYLYDGESFLAVAIFNELMQILTMWKCTEAESFERDKLVIRVKMALSKATVQEDIRGNILSTNTHCSSQDPLEPVWEGLPARPQSPCGNRHLLPTNDENDQKWESSSVTHNQSLLESQEYVASGGVCDSQGSISDFIDKTKGANEPKHAGEGLQETNIHTVPNVQGKSSCQRPSSLDTMSSKTQESFSQLSSIQQKPFEPNRFHIFCQTSTDQGQREDSQNGENALEEHLSENTGAESTCESNADGPDIESISEASEVSSTNEASFQTVIRKKQRGHKGADQPNGSKSTKSKKKRRKRTNKETPSTTQQPTVSQPTSTVNLPNNVCFLPVGVSLVCAHFMADFDILRKAVSRKRNVCKRCDKNEAIYNVRYAFWSEKFMKWFYVRDRPANVRPNVAFQSCKNFIRGENCKIKDGQCKFGHGPEVMVWNMAREGALMSPKKAFYCTIKEETMNRENVRRPPPQNAGDFKLCDSVHSRILCRFGRGCRNAHSEDELLHWKEEYEKKVTANIRKQQGDQEQLSVTSGNRPRQPPYKKVEALPGVSLRSEPENPNVSLTDGGDIHNHKWMFFVRYKIEEEKQFPMVFLEKRHSGYFSLNSVDIIPVDSPNQPSTIRFAVPQANNLHFKPPESILISCKSREIEIKVEVKFCSRVYGSFAQSILFDFGREPLLIKAFNIDVLSSNMNKTLEQLNLARTELSAGDTLTFDEGKIIRMETIEEESRLLTQYDLPKDAESIVSSQMVRNDEQITPDSYIQVMHQLLFAEEAHMRKLVLRLSPSAVTMKITKSFSDQLKGLTMAMDGEFFGTVTLQKDITPDDVAGRVCTRKVKSVLLQHNHDKDHLYEAPIELLKGNQVIVRLCPRLCQDLKIDQDGQDINIQMRFHIDRLIMCRMHRSLDRLTETHKRLLFPSRESARIPEGYVPSWLSDLDKRLNENQLRVLNAITNIQAPSPPLVVFGPFGTGKTFTLNQAILHLVTKQNNRVLLCTHTNSAADIHVSLLDQYISKIKAAKPLRICDPKRKSSTIAQVARKYCLFENDAFVLPSREDLDKHQVVVTTLVTADHLVKLGVGHGFFTHILIDEAAQTWETETIIPIALAGPNTRIVLTGDHMQMSPEVYTKFACPYGLQKSLPERLFDYYHQTETEISMENMMFLRHNYRSNSKILQFPSDNFYGGEIVPMGDEENPEHPHLGALMFYTSRGKDIKQDDNTYLNAAEVSEIVKRVKELVQSWPHCWGPVNLQDIAVVAPYKYQVQTIRKELRNNRLGKVTVDTIHNAQGMEFRALYISTVRTLQSIQEFEESPENLSLEFLSDPKLLATVVTRAKSLIAVVGDPVSLCTLGDCKYLWRNFITRCNDLGKLHGMEMEHLTREVNACSNVPKKLNPKAPTFIPRDPTANKFTDKQVCNEQVQEDYDEKDEELSTSGASDADDECEEWLPSKELRISDPPPNFDKIIESFIKEAKASSEEGQALRSFPSGGDEIEQSGRENKPNYKRVKSSDYEMHRIHGREEIRLIGLHQGGDVNVVKYNNRFSQDHLSPELLQELLQNYPERYMAGKLRVAFGSRTSYVEFPDKTKPDIKITGDVRQAFDRDTIVIEIEKLHAAVQRAFHPDAADVGNTNLQVEDDGRRKSSKLNCVRGILHNLINPRERQYVCRLDESGHSLFIPINKSVPKFVNLSDKSCKWIPVYELKKNGKVSKRYPIKRIRPKDARQTKCLFLVRFLQWRSDCFYPLGAVLRTLTQSMDINDCMGIAYAEHGVRQGRAREVERECENSFPENWEIPENERRCRKEITNAFTIDPEGSKDLDDAVSIDQLSDQSFKVGIHIADVSFFVKPGSKLDEDAKNRGTTYYPNNPDFDNIPMLPRILSENHCSLLENKDRLTQTVYVFMDSDGVILKPPEIESTITCSQCQLTYSEAQQIIEKKELEREDDIGEEGMRLLRRSIPLLHSLAQKRRRHRLGIVDHSGKDDIAAHELIEELMILANQAVGDVLNIRNHCTTPFVSHVEPKVHRLNKWAQMYGRFAQYHPAMRQCLEGGDIHHDVNVLLQDQSTQMINITIFKSVWETLRSAPDTIFVMLPFLISRPECSPQLQMARESLNRISCRSEYKCAPEGAEIAHHGLCLKNYVHFTSPIRRYMDIEIHRSLKSEKEDLEVEDVEAFCRRSTFIKDNNRKFSRTCREISNANRLKECNKGLEMIIDELDNHSFMVHARDPEQDFFSHHNNRISYQDLAVYQEPEKPDENEETTLTWIVRIYKSPTEEESKSDTVDLPQYRERKSMRDLLPSVPPQTDDQTVVYQIQGQQWLNLIEASSLENNNTEIRRLIQDIMQNSIRVSGNNRLNMEPFDDDDGHFYRLTMKLRRFDKVNIQLFPRLSVSVLTPDIQLFMISSNFHICVEHRRLPRRCFAFSHHELASKGKSYASVEDYIQSWKPVLVMEIASSAVSQNEGFLLMSQGIRWTRQDEGKIVGNFSLKKSFCKTRQLNIKFGDLACVRIPTDKRSIWVAHCIFRNVDEQELDVIATVVVHNKSQEIPEILLDGKLHVCDLEVIYVPTPLRRMYEALLSQLEKSTDLVQTICCGWEPTQNESDSYKLPNVNVSRSLCDHGSNSGFKPLNKFQLDSVEDALKKRFSLIQGPPGTGKTVTGVHIAYWFTKQNSESMRDTENSTRSFAESLTDVKDEENKSKAPPQVLYCGPSNKSVDVVAEYLLRIPEMKGKIVRVYGSMIEEIEFPITNKIGHRRVSKDELRVPEGELKEISLHHLIRRPPCPYASELKKMEAEFKQLKEKKVQISDEIIDEYCATIKAAEKWVIEETDKRIILCTCSRSGSKLIKKACNIFQCIVDESGMCTEPEILVPLTSSKAKQIVLIGDHKQLQPIVTDSQAKKLGLNRSMFERLHKEAKMLRIQYRMHQEICAFPSEYFYDSMLETDDSVKNRQISNVAFWPAGRKRPITFCHVEGEEMSSEISTVDSGVNSKYNKKEADKAVQVAKKLVNGYGVKKNDVVILTPYREQRKIISKKLKETGYGDVKVTTIIKSQGSEWGYVIISLVRSLMEDDIDPEPSNSWLSEQLGFIRDEHQINVALTRAKYGICVIGNKNLLSLDKTWEYLIRRYEENGYIVEGSQWPT